MLCSLHKQRPHCLLTEELLKPSCGDVAERNPTCSQLFYHTARIITPTELARTDRGPLLAKSPYNRAVLNPGPVPCTLAHLMAPHRLAAPAGARRLSTPRPGARRRRAPRAAPAAARPPRLRPRRPPRLAHPQNTNAMILLWCRVIHTTDGSLFTAGHTSPTCSLPHVGQQPY